jgi:hypothetical protein
MQCGRHVPDHFLQDADSKEALDVLHFQVLANRTVTVLDQTTKSDSLCLEDLSPMLWQSAPATPWCQHGHDHVTEDA